MSFLLLAVAGFVALAAYFLVRKHFHDRQDSAKIACDRTEDKFFYQALAERELPGYQQALDEVFGLIQADRFSGSRVPVPQQAAVSSWLDRQSGDDAERPNAGSSSSPWHHPSSPTAAVGRRRIFDNGQYRIWFG